MFLKQISAFEVAPAALGQDTSIDTEVDGEEDKEDEEDDGGDTDDDDLNCCQKGSVIIGFENDDEFVCPE